MGWYDGRAGFLSHHPRRFELFSPNKIENLTLLPLFLSDFGSKQSKNRLTILSSGLLPRYAPNWIHFELINIKHWKIMAIRYSLCLSYCRQFYFLFHWICWFILTIFTLYRTSFLVSRNPYFSLIMCKCLKRCYRRNCISHRCGQAWLRATA